MREFFIDTPFGKLRVYAKHQEDCMVDFPGVFVDLVHTVEGEEVSDVLCCVEVEYDSCQDRLQTCVYDPGCDEPKGIVIHTIDSDGDATSCEDIYVVYVEESMDKTAEDLAVCLFQGLRDGERTQTGDRTSPYYVIARGENRPDNKVLASITECISDVKTQRYMVRVTDNVRNSFGGQTYTEDLTIQSLCRTLETLLNNMLEANAEGSKAKRPEDGPWTVHDLTVDELNELKQAYLCRLAEADPDLPSPSYGDLADASQIPNDIIFNHYAGVAFMRDDFLCNLKPCESPPAD